MRQQLPRFAAAACMAAAGVAASTQPAQPGPAAGPKARQADAPGIRIRLVIDGQTATASLDDNPAAREFAALLPLTLTLSDHAATEKIADLPQALSQQGSPAGYTPQQGDIAYYAPWGNLALFHKDFAYSSGLIRLGRFDSSVEILRRPGRVQATIELIGAPAR